MTSRKQAQNRHRKCIKQRPAYVREYAYNDDGIPVMEEGHNVTTETDGTLVYDKKHQVYRDRPNRAMVRQYAAKLRKEK